MPCGFPTQRRSGFCTVLKIDGEVFNLDDLLDNHKSPHMECRTGSEVVTVRYGNGKWESDFEKNTVTEVKKF